MEAWQSVLQNSSMLIQGLGYTLEYSLYAVVLGTVLGLIFALFRLSGSRILRALGTVYVDIFRGTPLLVQIFFIYFGLPQVLPLHQWFGDFYTLLAGAAALALNEGAYITEIIRAGILSVDKGQWEAAESIGMTSYQKMRYIILPQAFKRMIPPLVNQFIQTIKDTSLLSVISITELVRAAQIVIVTTYFALQFWTAVAVLYLIVILLLTKLSQYLERRLQVDQR
ncbi:nickel transporter [Kyrpidia spormannii]|uniref:Cystine ABC transporter (Permease) n=2 Tax=Kyrpidia spormannii TaxID=2055160 RepID=A0A2K8N5B2_9BACL|nr:amino acid ABC transporter permease [Kyrpidia spormannii]ATY83662.1 nickel transporter [Kyrpidia spormannii]CAB3389298.1 cystine ABC transporter (permease) [Kyrpidia spormannii]CAB3389858.1 cystine ABC transporter (permease) [Kyrpidia spormannii]